MHNPRGLGCVQLAASARTSVIFVPGHGLAVAHAQHKVREFAGLLEKKGCQVRYAIHPIAGMPVLTVWDARTVVVVKRSLASGYAGIRNELFQMDKSLMFLADAKKAHEDTITELKAL